MKKLFAPILLAGLLLNITPAHAGWFSASPTQSGWMQSATNWAMNHPLATLASLSVLGLSAYGLWDYWSKATPPQSQLKRRESHQQPTLHVILYDINSHNVFLGIDNDNVSQRQQGWSALHSPLESNNTTMNKVIHENIDFNKPDIHRTVTLQANADNQYIIAYANISAKGIGCDRAKKQDTVWIPAAEFQAINPNQEDTDPNKKNTIERLFGKKYKRVPHELHTLLHNHFKQNPPAQPVASSSTHVATAPQQPSGANVASTSGHAVQPQQPVGTNGASSSKGHVVPESQLSLDKKVRDAIESNWRDISGAIYFYDNVANNPNKSDHNYYAFTNFHQAQVPFNGATWRTSEHAYQAQKFTQRPDIQTLIQQEPLASKVFTVAQKHGDSVDKDWKKRSLQTMVDVVRAKFKQNKNLAQQLLNTGTAILVEASPKDGFYGYSTAPKPGDKSNTPQKAENHLGRILMHVRAELRGVIPTGQPYNEYARYPAYYARLK